MDLDTIPRAHGCDPVHARNSNSKQACTRASLPPAVGPSRFEVEKDAQRNSSSSHCNNDGSKYVWPGIGACVIADATLTHVMHSDNSETSQEATEQSPKHINVVSGAEKIESYSNDNDG